MFRLLVRRLLYRYPMIVYFTGIGARSAPYNLYAGKRACKTSKFILSPVDIGFDHLRRVRPTHRFQAATNTENGARGAPYAIFNGSEEAEPSPRAIR